MTKRTVTQEEIDKIFDESIMNVSTIFDKCTVVSIQLKNGFILTETSACVDKSNYNRDLGLKICIQKIKEKIWEFEGYRLQCELSKQKEGK